MTLIPEFPTPKNLLKEANAEKHQRPYDLLKFGEVIDTLFRKGFSNAKIAKWLSVRLGVAVERGQVFYIYKKWLGKQESARNHKILFESEGGASAGPLSEEETSDPELDKFLQESEERRLNAEADQEDSKRKGKGRKKA